MRIQFKPSTGSPESTHVLTLDVWKNGEVKNIDEDRRVRIKIDGLPHSVRVVDDLMGDPDFVDADLGYNPNFKCNKCGVTTYAEAYIDLENYGRQTDPYGRCIILELDNQRVCQACYEADAAKHRQTN